MNYLDRIESYREEMIHNLQNLIAIPSVVDEPEGNMPFGRDVHKAFLYMLDLAKKEGFKTANIDNYGGHIEFGKECGEIFGILAHLDVVPEGKGWDYPPYEGRIVDGRIYGRGAIDDKGPTIAAFYALKALKEEGFTPNKKIRLILGLDEEAGTGWEGMTEYLRVAGKPDLGFTPDAEFPAIHAEMGILIFEIAKKIDRTVNKGLELRSLTAGNAPNMVPDYARAILYADSYDEIISLAESFEEKAGYKIHTKGIGKSLEITAQGTSSHGARPEKGLNAISILMLFLGKLSFSNDDIVDFIHFYNEHIGFDIHGEGIGCDFSDDVSRKLIFNVGMANVDREIAKITVNIRYPVTMNQDEIYSGIMPRLDNNGLGLIKINHQASIYVPEENPLIVTLMDVYRKHTGDYESKPIVTGGGTYARAVENTVAFGMLFPDEPDLAHQANENILIDNLIKATKIYADAIYNLTK